MKLFEIASDKAIAAKRARLKKLQADLREIPSQLSSAEHAEAVEDINAEIKKLQKELRDHKMDNE